MKEKVSPRRRAEGADSNLVTFPETAAERENLSASRKARLGSTAIKTKPAAADTDSKPSKPSKTPATRFRLMEAFRSQPVLSYYLLLVVTLLLFIIGFILVFSASTIGALDENVNPFLAFSKRALIYVVSLLILLVASRLPVVFFRKWALIFLVAAWIMQVLVFLPGFHGVGVGGNTNWIVIPGINLTLQPSEFIKFALVVYLGRALSDSRLRASGRVRDWLMYVGLPSLGSLALVMAGRDLGTAMVMAALILVAIFIAGIPWKYLAPIVVLGLFALSVAVMGSENRRRRVFGFADASTVDPTGIGYQRQHGLWSLATGGLTGVGPGASREKWSYLPEADTDYIFAILGEEFGLLGTFLTLGLFTVMCLTLLRIMNRAEDDFVTYTVAGIIGWIFSQTIINIGAVVGLLPIIGVPLPLISSGGSSLLAIMGALGVAMCFARHEPGARQALRARVKPLQRSLAVLGARRKREEKNR